MKNVNPPDLTEAQWLLLRQLHKYNAPFYTEFLYTQFSEYQIERLEFYRMFFMLVALNYVQIESIGMLIPGQKQDFSYVVTPKGKRTIKQFTLADGVDYTDDWAPKPAANDIIAAYSANTTILKNFVFHP